MNIAELFQTEIFGLVIVPLLIFSARVVDVSLQTLRIIFTSKDKRNLAPIVGFFEVLIWLVAMGQIVQNLTNISYYIAYAGGFAVGNYMGINIERKLSVGLISVHLILRKDPHEVINILREQGYKLTILTAEGKSSEAKLIISVIKRKKLQKYLDIIEENSRDAFISVEHVQYVKDGFSPEFTNKRKLLFKSLKRK